MVRQTFVEAARLFERSSESSGYQRVDLAAAVTDDVEETAANIRACLGLAPSDPVPNATRALERLGVGVVHGLMGVNVEAADHHGLSCPTVRSGRPLVATVGEQPGAVARMTLMHELGHILYDGDLTKPIRARRDVREQRAFRFAGAMLIPASVMQRRVTESLTLHAYLAIKADYGVSVSALIKRASDLGLISPERSRSLFIQLSSQGWRRREPVAVPHERALLLGQAAAFGISDDPREVARATGVRLSHVTRWTGMEMPPPANVLAFNRSARRGG